MKRFIVLLIVLLLPVQVFAGDRYIKGNIGIFSLEDSTLNLASEDNDVDIGDVSSDTGFGINAAIGKSFANGFDLELEYGFKTADLDEATPSDEVAEYTGDFEVDVDGNVDIHSLMANAIYNFKSGASITPYAGAGIGLGFVNIDLDDAGDISDTVFAYQLMAGVAFNVSNNMDILAGYRYFGTSDITEDGTFYGYDVEGSATVDSHNFEVGLKYSF